jgi:hypothetical protein
MADLVKQINKVLGADASARSPQKPKSSDGGGREVVFIGVGLAAMLGFGLWQVWTADKPKPQNKGA